MTIVAELATLGISVSPHTVARLLRKMGYSLRVNHQLIATDSSPDRNLQFEYLAHLRDRFRQRHLPIVSVDSKKRELVGAVCHQVITLDRAKLTKRIGALSRELVREVESGLRAAMDLD